MITLAKLSIRRPRTALAAWLARSGPRPTVRRHDARRPRPRDRRGLASVRGRPAHGSPTPAPGVAVRPTVAAGRAAAHADESHRCPHTRPRSIARAHNESRISHSEEVKSDGAASPAAGSQTLGQMILEIARRHHGVALQFQRDGRTAYISYPELGTICSEIARGLISLGIERGDRVAILGLTSADWTLADCGAMVRRRGRGADLPHQFPRGMRLRARRLRVRAWCSARTPSQAAKIEQIRDRCPALEHVVFFEAAVRRRDLRSTSCGVVARKCRPASVAERLAEVIPRRCRHARLHIGYHRTAQGVHAHATPIFWRRPGCTSEQLHFNETHSLYQFLPLAHVLARVAQVVALSAGAKVIYWTRRPRQDRRRAGRDRADALPCGPAHLREDPQRR